MKAQFLSVLLLLFVVSTSSSMVFPTVDHEDQTTIQVQHDVEITNAFVIADSLVVLKDTNNDFASSKAQVVTSTATKNVAQLQNPEHLALSERVDNLYDIYNSGNYGDTLKPPNLSNTSKTNCTITFQKFKERFKFNTFRC